MKSSKSTTPQVKKTTEKIQWAKYETEVFESCKINFPNAVVLKNQKIRGVLSGRSRQIDILIKESVGGKSTNIVIDCKLYSRKTDIKHVESFIGMMADVRADKGLMISEKGYSESALKRAYNNPEHLELDIYSLAELKSHLHGETAIPYSTNQGVILIAPFGWIVDATRRDGAICTLYQKGLDLQEAQKQFEFAYINFWIKPNDKFKLEELIKDQEKYMSEGKTVRYMKYLKSVERNDGKTLIRIADIKEYPALELTGFVEFEEFIFFCVCFTLEVNLRRNIRKIEGIIRSIIPVKLELQKSQS